MGTEPLVLLTRIKARLSTEDDSMALLAIQYRSCCFSSPSLIRRSVSRGWVAGSKSSPRRVRAADVYSVSLVWTFAFGVRVGPICRVVHGVRRCRLALV